MQGLAATQPVEVCLLAGLLIHGGAELRTALTPEGKAPGDLAFLAARKQPESALEALWPLPGQQTGRVLLVNDPFTPMETVVEALRASFDMDREAAVARMLQVHRSGAAEFELPAGASATGFCTSLNQAWRAAGLPLYCVPERRGAEAPPFFVAGPARAGDAVEFLGPPGPALRMRIGVPVFLHWSVFAIGGGFALLPAMTGDGIGFAGFFYTTLFVLLLVALHELGHAVAAWAWGSKVLAVVLSGYGGLCCIDRMPSTRAGRLVFIAGGFIAQAAAFAAAALAVAAWGWPSSLAGICAVAVFLGINPLMACWNALPHGGSDGARLLEELRRRAK